MRCYALELKHVYNMQVWRCYVAQDNLLVRSKDFDLASDAKAYGERWVRNAR